MNLFILVLRMRVCLGRRIRMSLSREMRSNHRLSITIGYLSRNLIEWVMFIMSKVIIFISFQSYHRIEVTHDRSIIMVLSSIYCKAITTLDIMGSNRLVIIITAYFIIDENLIIIKCDDTLIVSLIITTMTLIMSISIISFLDLSYCSLNESTLIW